MGRPSDYNQDIADRICERMICGANDKPESLRSTPLVEIYALLCPDTGAIKYIGKANDSVKRFRSHIRDSRRKTTPVCRWIQQLTSVGLLPVLHIIDRVEASDWKQAEKSHISKHAGTGLLLNLSKGGNQPYLTDVQQVASGKRLADTRLNYDAKQRRLYEAKKSIGSYLKFLEKSKDFARLESWKAKLRCTAKKYPGQFECWANL